MTRLYIFLFLCLLGQAYFYAQVPEACKSTRVACPAKNVNNCQEKVAFDEQRNIYLLRKDYATPYSGNCTSCYSNFLVEEKLYFENGKREGRDTSYYRTGCIQAIQEYHVGLQNGSTTIFYDSTQWKQFEIWYKNGVLDGPSIQFNRNERQDTLMLKNYANGKLHGEQRSYLPNGKLRKVTHYNNGLLDGPMYTLTEKGSKESQLNYKNGKKNGVWTYYFDSGKTARIENWKDGKKNGEFKTFDERGQVLNTENYLADIPVGKHESYYTDGKLSYSCTFSNKGEKIEEFVIDEYGVKKQLFPQAQPNNIESPKENKANPNNKSKN
jgi:antitoxin component YwqK of YwqJK toxin-antitoxin module